MRHVSALLLLTPLLQAQGFVSPNHFTSAEANTYSDDPFGTRYNPCRYLQIHGDVPAMTIQSLAVRRDGVVARVDEVGYAIVADVVLSTAATTVAAPAAAFDANHGPDKTQVATFKLVNFPASRFGPIPRPFDYRIPFDRAFVFGGQGPLCWEIRIQSRQNQNNPYHDLAYYTVGNPPINGFPFGVGCKGSGYTAGMVLNESASVNWAAATTNLAFSGTSAPKSSIVFLLLGVNDQSFGGIPLPFELPTTSGAASGKCLLYVSPVLFLPTFTTATGTFSTSLGLPAGPEYNGARVFTQVLGSDAAANPIGFVTSNYVSHNWTAPFGLVPVSRVTAPGGLGANGTVGVNTGLVVRFE